MGVEQQLVEDLLSFYWADVRKSIVEMRGPRIFVEGLGTFVVKHWKLPELEEKYLRYLKYYEDRILENRMSFQKFAIKKEVEVRIAKIQAIRAMSDKELERKKQVKEKRNADIAKGNLQSPQADT
jgi:DNA-binding transcriptional regulator PaaX